MARPRKTPAEASAPKEPTPKDPDGDILRLLRKQGIEGDDARTALKAARQRWSNPTMHTRIDSHVYNAFGADAARVVMVLLEDALGDGVE